MLGFNIGGIGGIQLPNQEFFVPNEDFLNCFAKFVIRGEDLTRRIFEVGCGTGKVAKLLRESGFNCIGMDSNYRSSQENVLIADALEYDSYDDGIILVCRPDHSGWVEELYESTECPFVYVGLERNIDVDLSDDMQDVMTILARNVGEEGEHIWLIRGYE